MYAYVQSYVLLRLGLIFASNMEEGKFLLQKKLGDITSKVQMQTKLLPTFLDIAKIDSKMNMSIQKEIDLELKNNMPQELCNIRTATIDFQLKTYTFCLQSNELENSVLNYVENYRNPNKKAIDEMMNHLEIVGAQAALCNDEHNRLMITINKYLNKNYEEPKAVTPEKVDDENESRIATIKEDDVQEQKDDFFYVDPAAENNDEEKKDDDEKPLTNEQIDEDDMQIKLTKKQFNPVLAQLKERIVVIGDDMKEREKKVLKEKGIEVPDEPKIENGNSKWTGFSSESGSGGSSENLNLKPDRKKKIKRNRMKFDESREFLQSKQQYNMMCESDPIPIPQVNINLFGKLREEILE